MIRPTEADLGREVIYREKGDFPGRKVEYGVLTSFSIERPVAFVRYGTACSSAATDLEDLEWAIGGDR